MISTIVAKLRVILSETMRFEEPVKIKELPIAEEQPHVAIVEPDDPTLGEIKKAWTLGSRTATMVVFITLGAATLGTQWWMDRKVSKKAEAEMQVKQENDRQNCLSRNPDVIVWLGADNCKTITTLDIEQTAEKITLAKKYPALKIKYAGEKIQEVTLLALLFEVPQEIENYPHYAKRMREAWASMCQQNMSKILELSSMESDDKKRAIIELLSQYF